MLNILFRFLNILLFIPLLFVFMILLCIYPILAYILFGKNFLDAVENTTLIIYYAIEENTFNGYLSLWRLIKTGNSHNEKV